MSSKSRKRRAPKSAPQVRTLRTAPNWPLLAVSTLGIALTGYLSWVAFAGGAVRGCPAGGGCDLVLTSRWATLLGLPTSFWGLLAYIALAAIAFVKRADRHWSYAWTVALFGICYSVYLTVVSLTILGSACPYCLTSLRLMTATLALVAVHCPTEYAQRCSPCSPTPTTSLGKRSGKGLKTRRSVRSRSTLPMRGRCSMAHR